MPCGNFVFTGRDLDELILAKMVREAGMFYKMELDRVKG